LFRTFSWEFLGKTIFQNFFCGNFQFSPTFLGENFPPNFPWKNVRKISPRGQFFNGFSRLRKKFAPTEKSLRLATVSAHARVGAYWSFKKLASGTDVMFLRNIF
jgi:hypothetical protein